MDNILLPMLFGAAILHIICRIAVYFTSKEEENTGRQTGHIVLYIMLFIYLIKELFFN